MEALMKDFPTLQSAYKVVTLKPLRKVKTLKLFSLYRCHYGKCIFWRLLHHQKD